MNAESTLKTKQLAPCMIAYGLVFLMIFNIHAANTVFFELDDTIINPRPSPGYDYEHGHKSNNVHPDVTSLAEGQMSPLQLYRKLFQQKRQIHIEAVKTIMSLEHYEKQYEMVKLVLQKMFTVVLESKVFLMEQGFSPGDPFPEEEKIKDALSKVAENTAFFGDILLRMPDITHDILRRNREWELAALWGLGFCNESLIFKEADFKLLNLMGQELGVLEKDPDYVNPYKTEQNLKRNLDVLLAEEKRQQKKLGKKEKKKKKRGPRLSHTEL